MATRTEIPVKIHSRNNRDLAPTVGLLCVVEWTHQERLKNAIKMFGMMIMITCFGAAMPPFHILFGTTLFITTWVMTMEKFSQVKYVEGGSGSCPKCKAEL